MFMKEFSASVSRTWIVTKRELSSYFNSPIAYIFITVFLVVMSWLFFNSFFLAGQASMRAFFGLIPWVFLILVPAITMRMWAEERRSGTDEMLLTLPLRDFEVVLAKFFASFLFLAVGLLLSFIIPILISFVGNLDWGITLASYAGALFLGASYIAIGLWVSSLTSNQIVAFIVSVVLCFVLFIVGQDFVIHIFPSFLSEFFQLLSLSSHFESISRGVIDSRDVFYYLSVIGYFLYLNVLSLHNRR
jgi:ABC-2 type transport system permease protein